MIIKVLGSAAGGGFPQANCNCRNCADLRLGRAGLEPRTQSSLAVSADGQSWLLLNASPDLRQQIGATPALAPRPGKRARSSPIASVVLTNGDVDHVAGLLSLREGFAFTLYASGRVLDALAANSIFNVLRDDCVGRVELPLEGRIEVEGGLVVAAYAVPGKVALYLEDGSDGFGTREGDSIGIAVSDPATGALFHYVPGCAAIDISLAQRLRGARLVLFDGTLYTDDEMIVQGLSEKTGQRMGHMPMAGPDGSMAAFAELDVERRVYVHINNSNPTLRQGSPERLAVERAGWEIAHDGMEFRL
ncbi:MAG TPA: pyrroloquinoline quinone biosynthesis protein PqqB [Hyphomicrobiaceae bacterium]|jgi:pyrroloquinoline quinone biosynthesis protein B|nr:pyrroloquinoline quinone biosynthesis protein PqqB [Hyphomicrobiaceae bacterium]